MIRVHLARDASGTVVHFWVSGHAGYDKHGQDIVCAAISVLSQATVLGLEQVAKQVGTSRIRDGYLEWQTEQMVNTQAKAILETMVLGVQDIATSFPKHVMLIETKEEPS